MSRLTHIAWLGVGAVLLFLSACGSAANATDPSLVYTQIWQTVEAAQTQTGLYVSPTPVVTSTPLDSATPRATNTPLLSPTPLPGAATATPFTLNTFSTPTGSQVAPVSTQGNSCDNMTGVADVTYPDNSEVPAGTVFVKTWSVKNLGPCSWGQNYRLAFGWGGVGTSWNTTPPSYLSAAVLPGETIEISVSLKAPTAPGKYSAAFRLQNTQGYNFGPVQTVVVVVK